ncbi:MAG: hypothetical protein S4CHLAM6_13630 [Chlamydiae bacterium]|nr:hypothetical protein [Chlamydiota bacterium]
MHLQINHNSELFVSQTATPINESGSLRLNAETINGSVNAGGSIHAASTTIRGDANAGKNAHIDNCVLEGSLNAGTSVYLNSSMATSVSSGENIVAVDCLKLGKLSSGKSIEVKQCPSIQSIDTGGALVLTESCVHGNVAATNIEVKESQIHGTLISAGLEAKVHSSTIQDIYVKKAGTSVVVDKITTSSIDYHLSEAPKKIVILSGHTVIKGNINFEDQNGQVILLDSAVIEGKVLGGEVLKR